MQSSETYPQSRSTGHRMPFCFINGSLFKNKTFIYSRCSAIKKEPINKLSSNQASLLSTNEYSSSFSQVRSPSKKTACDETQSKANYCISLIEDPLWKKVCIEFINMMGPISVLKIWKSNLGSLSPQNNTIDLSCQTEEAAQLLQQYDFVILGILRRYFSALKELRISINI